MANRDNLIIEDARIMFRNFAGREQQFNSAGDRNFCLMLEPELAEQLKRDGWNVKELRAREDGDEPQPYLQVSVNYGKGRPPRVVLINSRGRLDLGADEVSILDYADIKQIDVVINPYEWEVSGNSGIKAYLKNAFVTINEDALERKYADLPDANPSKVLSSTASELDSGVAS